MTAGIELAFPASVPGFDPRCPDCRALIGTSPPDARECKIFHDPEGAGHDLCPVGPPFVVGSLGLLGHWEEELASG